LNTSGKVLEVGHPVEIVAFRQVIMLVAQTYYHVVEEVASLGFFTTEPRKQRHAKS
jgi:hypothetical protein